MSDDPLGLDIELLLLNWCLGLLYVSYVPAGSSLCIARLVSGGLVCSVFATCRQSIPI